MRPRSLRSAVTLACLTTGATVRAVGGSAAPGSTLTLRIPAAATGAGGAPPARVKVSLRTSAADAAGGTITETLINAYQTR